MESTVPFKLAEPRFTARQAMQIVGFSGTYTREQTADIPAQWDRFNAALAAAPPAGWDGEITYRVVYPATPMRYVSGVELTGGAPTPDGWEQVTVPPQTYAVFVQTGGIPAIRAAWMAIFMEWLPLSGMTPASGPMLETYPENWIESGDFEIWIPVE